MVKAISIRKENDIWPPMKYYYDINDGIVTSIVLLFCVLVLGYKQ